MYVGLIPCNEFATMKPVEIDGTGDDYRRLVGGWLETAPCHNRKYLLVIDEEGKLKGKPMNWLATTCYFNGLCDPIVGDAVFVRLNEAGDDWTGWDSAADVIIAFDKM